MFNNFWVSTAHGQNHHIFIIFSRRRNSFRFLTMFFSGYLCMIIIIIDVRKMSSSSKICLISVAIRSNLWPCLNLIKLRTMQSFCPRLAACCFVRFSLNYYCYANQIQINFQKFNNLTKLSFGDHSFSPVFTLRCAVR